MAIFSVSGVRIPGFLCSGEFFSNYLESRKDRHRLQSSHLYHQNSLPENLSLARILLLFYASNSTNKMREGFYRFRHTVSGPGVNVSRKQEHIHEDPEEDDISPNGGTYGPYYSQSLSISISNGTTGQRYTSDAYVRLVVSGNNDKNQHVEDHWFVENRKTFKRN